MPSSNPISEYAVDVIRLAASYTTTESTFYPAIRQLLASALRSRGLPFDVRTGTSEARDGGGTDLPDIALYDGSGDFIVVAGEVKLPDADLQDLARTTARNDQVGRYLSSTRAILVSNVRGFALVTVQPDWNRRGPVPPEARRVELAVEFWPSASALRRGDPVAENAFEQFCDIVEAAATRYAPIAEPASLARVLARQARAAKASLPREFSHAVTPLLEDFSAALGISFTDEEGEEFFRSSLIQTAFYALFAGWVLWSFERRTSQFRWEDVGEYLKIRFLAQLFHEFRHPARIRELQLAPHLDAATETLRRVDTDRFFAKFKFSSPTEDDFSAAPIVYFYEPFLEAFDPDLRKELGVWYTPPEIVRYQVRNIDRILRDELSCPRGFADDRVVVLDPSCGTGAYLLEVMRVIVEQLRSEGEEALLAARAADAFAKRIIGFEILTAPFVVAQLQIYLNLARLGATPETFRPAVFLTNSLTGWTKAEQLNLTFPELQEEHDAAQRVKTDAEIIVILGNPPYNRFASAPIKEESDLVDYYKGIKRDDRGRQVGQSQLYERWGVRKHLLDDLYIRFFRIAEKSIGEKATFGVVSFISNSSYLTGRSHPIMRESLLSAFHKVWIDNLHGNRLASERTPSGASCETIFSMQETGGAGIKVGTTVTTMCKTGRTRGQIADVYVRDFWGRADEKRAALLESLSLDSWSDEHKRAAAASDPGPRPYVRFTPTAARGWRLTNASSSAGYEDWPALDEVFPTSWQGINPNRGLSGSIIDTDRATLAHRMQTYFDRDISFDEIARAYPELAAKRARYDPKRMRDGLLRASQYADDHVVPYLLFPFDVRWIYYEPDAKLLNERRQEIWDNRTANEFLVAVPQARRPSEVLPILATTLFDLHLHDRGSVGFPADVQAPRDLLSPNAGKRIANLNENVQRALQRTWHIEGSDLDLGKSLCRELFRLVLVMTHAPDFINDHRDHLTHDFARVPIPRSRELFDAIVADGHIMATLLNPTASAEDVLGTILGEHRPELGVLAATDQTPIKPEQLRITQSYYGPSRGSWRPTHQLADNWPAEWGIATGDLYLNERVRFRNIPENVWRFELGGYPVLKKWLGYRQANQRDDMPLTLAEVSEFRQVIHRIAAILRFHTTLNGRYRDAAADAFVAVDLGL